MSYARDEVMTWATGQVNQGADDHVDQVRELAERKFAEIQKLERRLRSMYDAARLEGDQEDEAEVIGNLIREQGRGLLPGMSDEAERSFFFETVGESYSSPSRFGRRCRQEYQLLQTDTSGQRVVSPA